MLNLFPSHAPFQVWHRLDGNQPALSVIEKSVKIYGTLPKTILDNQDLRALLAAAPAKALRWIKKCSPTENTSHYHCPIVYWDPQKDHGLVLFIPDLPIEKLNRETLFA